MPNALAMNCSLLRSGDPMQQTKSKNLLEEVTPTVLMPVANTAHLAGSLAPAPDLRAPPCGA